MIPIVDAVQVSRYVDARIEYRADEWQSPNLWQKYVDPLGTDDWRDDMPKQGDCDDYAMSKRRMLLERGYSASDMRVAAVPVPGQYMPMHVVLLVNSERGWYALDINRFYKYAPNFRDQLLIDGQWRSPRTWDGEPSKYSSGYPPKGWVSHCDRKEMNRENDVDCIAARDARGLHIEFIRR